MKQIQYDVFHYLFGIWYNTPKHSSKLTVVSKLGYQQSRFDEYCQTWVYLYLYKRCFCKLSFSEWHEFMSHYEINNIENVHEKCNIGYDGTEITNPCAKKLQLIASFRDWFLHIDLIKCNPINIKKMNWI